MMKRFLFFGMLAAAVFAIGSYGGHMVGIAHAQTAATGTAQLTPAQTTALEQQLDVAKAELANLEMQAGQIPAGDNGTTAIPAMNQPVASNGLTPAQVTAMNTTLGTMASMLSQLSGSIAANTQLTPAQQSQVAATLGSMKDTLVAMAGTINGANGAAGNAAAAGSAPIAQQAAPVAQSAGAAANSNSGSAGSGVAANTAPSVSANGTAAPAAQATNNAAPAAQQTAQASSLWSFTKAHWPTIVIVLLVIAILAILFWPEKKEPVKTVSNGGNAGSGKPKAAPVPPPSVANISASMTQGSGNASASTKQAAPANSHSPAAPATPVASAVSAPAHK